MIHTSKHSWSDVYDFDTQVKNDIRRVSEGLESYQLEIPVPAVVSSDSWRGGRASVGEHRSFLYEEEERVCDFCLTHGCKKGKECKLIYASAVSASLRCTGRRTDK